MPYRVALLGMYHESNTFIAQPTTLDDFVNSHLLRGEAIRGEYQHAFHEIGGMLEVLDQHAVQTLPILFAEATPGGTITAFTYDYLVKEMLEGLERCLPIDGCLVVPHGAGVADSYLDMDGHWLAEVRRMVGGEVPIIGTLDPHANVSPLMVQSTDALVAYKTNPHIDQRETGKRAAELLIRHLKKEITPVQVLIQPPLVISIEQQNTAAEPCRSLLTYAKELSERNDVLSTSLILGFPYADVPDMGTSFIVVTNNNLPLATDVGVLLYQALTKVKADCVGPKQPIDAILPQLYQLPKPVLLLDMGDNIGGGSPGDSAFLLKALEEDGRYKSLHCICDPTAVAEIIRTDTDNSERVDLAIGNQEGIAEGKPYKTRVKLLRTGDGKFKETTPRHGGQVNYDMGNVAVVETQAGNVILLNSLRVPPFSLQQITSCGINPENFDIIVAKGVNAPIAAYEPVCPTRIQVDTPGVTQADINRFSYLNRRRPMFPFEA